MIESLEKTVRVMKRDICLLVDQGAEINLSLFNQYHELNDKYQALLERIREEERSSDYLKRGFSR